VDDGYLTIQLGRVGTAEVEIKKSRFLGAVRRCDSEDDARELVAEARRTHHSARHHCSAWVIGADRRLQRSSDDGEPGGTAGQPMLDVLNGRELSDVAVVVTRYFGGTLLGAGGLVRAYSEAAAAAVDSVSTIRRQRLELVSFSVAHDVVGRVESALRNQGFAIEDVAYAEVATVTVASSDVELLRATAAQLIGSPVDLESRGESWIDLPF
jgi:uncharacterized YigZ family protein